MEASLGDGNIAGNVKGVGGLAPGGADGPGGGLIKTFGSFFPPFVYQGFNYFQSLCQMKCPISAPRCVGSPAVWIGLGSDYPHISTPGPLYDGSVFPSYVNYSLAYVETAHPSLKLAGR